jgi:pimeloyl-ACP methyl ester carboxylesterase
MNKMTEPAGFIGFNNNLFERMRDMHRSWRTIDVPACFISGKQDWGTYQRPGVYEAMQTIACTRMIGCHLIEGAGHWVQQERPQQVSHLLLQFVKQAGERENR